MTTTIIGQHYEFDEKKPLGAGGMGTVYRGADIRTGQTVAIKQLKPELSAEGSDFIERFVREADALRRTNHPNIVSVLDTVQDGGRYYIVMEYVGGGSLADLLEETPALPVSRVLEIALDLADALTRAHRLKIVHRDIKPGNVLLAEDGTPRLTDFGVAHMGDKTRVTRTGAVVGTLNYVSPESLNGQDTDERADIWAFGIMLYEMLAGRRPFDEDTTIALITAIMTKPLPDLTELRSDVPAGLVQLIVQMLNKKPAERTDSMRRVGLTLEEIIKGGDGLPSTVATDLIEKAQSGRFDKTTSDPATLAQQPQPVSSIEERLESGEVFLFTRQRLKKLLISVALVSVVATILTLGFLRFFRPPREVTPTPTATPVVAAVQPTSSPPMPDGSGTPGRVLQFTTQSGTPISPDGATDNLQFSGFLDQLQVNLGQDNSLEVIFESLADQPALQAGEYGVLVVPFEDRRTQPDVPAQVAIAENLRQQLERGVSYSNLRVITLPGMGMAPLTGNQARALADTAGAAVIVWGYQDDEAIYANIHIGSLTPFTYNKFERSELERTINVTVRLTDDDDPLSPYVLGILGALHNANGLLTEVARIMTMTQDLDQPLAGEIVEGSADLHRYIYSFAVESDDGLQYIDAAIERDGGNPMLYLYRSSWHSRVGDFENFSRDVETAERIGPDEWITPELLANYGASINTAQLTDMEAYAQQRPDDWLLHYFISEHYYLQGNTEQAERYVNLALEAAPTLNTAHGLALFLAAGRGDVVRVGELADTLIREYPNPNLGLRWINAAFGGDPGGTMTIYAALSYLLIGQYESGVDISEDFYNQITALFAAQPNLTELPAGISGHLVADYLSVFGMAQCNLGNMDEAVRSLEHARLLMPEHPLIMVMLASVYRENDQPELASATLESLLPSTEAAFAQVGFIPQSVTCENYYETLMDLSE